MSDDHDSLAEIGNLLSTVDASLQTPGVTKVVVTGKDPLVKSSRIRFGATAVYPPIACGILAAQIHYMRTGVSQSVSADMRRAIHGLSIYWRFKPTVGGKMHNRSMLHGNPFLHDNYETKDGRRVMLCAVYPELRLKWYSFLKVPPYPKESVAHAVKQFDSVELETAAAEAGLPCTLVRTPDEWLETEQGKHIANNPRPAPVEKIGDAPPKPFPPSEKGAQPLAGIKVLMATHAIAGPSAGRTLAEYGADVLQIFHTSLGFEHEEVYNEANVGCRSTQLDFADEADLATFYRLVSEADVFIDSFRLSSFDKFGITTSSLLAANPSLVICSTKLYGLTGPWAGRAGFDMNAASASGVLAVCGGSATNPVFPELKLINDFTTGYFGAMGILAALQRRATIGGAWRVAPALARTAHYYLFGLGLVPQEFFDAVDVEADPEHVVGEPYVLEADTPKGRLRRLGHAIILSETPARWNDPILVCQGSNEPKFLV
ncbi:hypothetical protein MNV49_004126 [Pseudohyphozyma bogoriensis]|nr:hypothetical protein MNV49_004126 [Pseudohyphozyma bogoriensis]